MDNAAVESWALSVVDRIDADEPLEDARVELKHSWIDPGDAARRLAGQANAARGDRILWLVGLDEERGVVGASDRELAEWIPQVESHFNSVAPDLLADLVLSDGGPPFVALAFSTDRAPYVIENPAFGTVDGESVQFEVPWREGTRVRTARRTDLLRILEPIRRVPGIDALSATLNIKEKVDETGREYYRTTFNAELYVFPSPNDDQLVIPFHRCGVRLRLPQVADGTLNVPVRLKPPRSQTAGFASVTGMFRGNQQVEPEPDSHTVQSTNSEVVFTGSGKVVASASVDFVAEPGELPEQVRATIVMQPAHAPTRATKDLRLERVREDESEPDLHRWRLDWNSLL